MSQKELTSTDYFAVANNNKPQLQTSVIDNPKIVELETDPQAFCGFRTVNSRTTLNSLAAIDFNRGDKVIFDFGNHYVGHFGIDLVDHGNPMDSPLAISFKFAELPAELGFDSSTYQGLISSSWIQEEFLHIDHLPCHLELPRRYSFRYVEVEIKDTSSQWSVRLSKPYIKAQSAVNDVNIAPLKTKDKLLQRLDEVSIKTLRDCMQDVFEDGPKRDQRLWLGDLRLEALANDVTFKNYSLTKRCLYLFAGSITSDDRIPADVFTNNRIVPDTVFFFDYSLFFISVLKDYVQETNDSVTLTELYPIAKRAINKALTYVNDQGLLVAPDDWRVFVDWSQVIDKDTAGQGILLYTLKQFVELAKKVSDKDLLTYEQLVKDLTNSAVENLFDSEQQLFISGPRQEVNIASQVWMVLAHILSDQDNKALMDMALKRLFPITGIVTPYMYHHIVQALFESDHYEQAIKLLKSYWGKMIDLGADTFWEAFDPNDLDFSPYGSPIINSYCHAWSCTPTYLLRKYCPNKI